MKGPGLKPVENETKGSASRLSKEGKRYTYQLHVIQQPSRARACGSGAKSSADRRPVDPPPIVELKILEGDVNDGEPRDVTFQMNANYFLFTTLVQARNLAQGRVSQEKNLTVLTGTPVAGIVYLDRPNPAGYFIFPDLSVRHEGEYRLSFSLYEQLKEDKDDDQATEPSQLSASPFEHVTHRCEVISVPFTVFSAKKFPGLTESTSLSRMVAEQGCRVRIRRDVRMRRRDTKGGKDWEGYEDETADMRARISATPEASGYSGYMEPVPRPRSSSIASHPSLAPSNSRRPSLQDIGQGYHQSGYGTVPHTPHSGYPQSSPYGVGPSPNEHYAQQPYVQQQPPMQPPPPSYHQQSYQPPPPSTSQVASSQQTYYGYGPSGNATPIPPSPYGPSLPTSYEPSASSQRMSVDHASHATDRRRSSVQYGPPPPPPSRTEYHMPQSQQASYQYPPAGQVEYPYSSQPQHTSREPSSYSSTDGYSSRPIPPEPLQSSYRTSGAHTPSSARQPYHDKLPPLNTTLHAISTKMAEPSSPYSAVPTPPSTYLSSGLMSIDSHKRSYGNVFDDRHLSQPLRQGARPSLPTYGSTHYLGHYTAAADDDTASESDLLAQKCMSYRRADGRHIQRALPPTIE